MSPRFRSHRFLPLLIVVGLAVQLAASQTQAPEPTAPTGPRTGLVVGQVVDSSGAPVPEALVQLNTPAYSRSLATTPQGKVIADQEGRFFFANLPAGEYYIWATKEGYAGGVFGQRRASGGNQLLSLAEGERRTDARLTLWKHAVISGTVVDEAGEPVVGVMVQALKRQFFGGRMWFGSMMTYPYLVRSARTDDRGVFRIQQVEPGSYVVVVPSYLSTVPLTVLNTYRQDSRLLNELLAVTLASPGSNNWPAEMADTAQGQSRTLTAGNFALISSSRVSIPPPVKATGGMEVYRTTFYPTATTASAARVITVNDGDDRTGVNVTLRPVTGFRVSGRLVYPDGTAPPPTAFRLIGDAGKEVGDAGFEAANGMSDASGKFLVVGVPPGNYELKTAKERFGLEFRRGEETFWAQQRIAVGASDLEDVTLALRPTLRLEGRVQFRDASGQLTHPNAPQLRTVFFQPAFGDVTPFGIEGVDGTFATVARPGQYVVNTRSIAGWHVQSVTLDGKDITDRPFDLQADSTSMVITYSTKQSIISGTVKDARGEVSTIASVLVFPADPERWSGYGMDSRTVSDAPTSRVGAFKFEHLPPGDYYLIAIDDANTDNWTDPQNLEKLAREATRLTVGAGEPKTVDLTLKVVR